ncbi:MAG: peptidase S53, partial [Acidobacteria bacterium]|nr:peptidase S53 [Acidobacteriota bacterium]
NASALLSTLSGATVTSGSTSTGSTGTTTTTTTSGPQITTTSLTGTAGKALSATIGYSAPGATSLSISISGAPSGMSFSATSGAIGVSWAKPVAGTTNLVITLKDNLGQTTTATVKVTIAAA